LRQNKEQTGGFPYFWDECQSPARVRAGEKEDHAMSTRAELDPDVDDRAPAVPEITDYDEVHYVTYLRLLDAEKDGADWREVARIVLHRDPAAGGTRACWESHLARARWMTRIGYRKILEKDAAEALATRH
jgi:hypothetical protein